MRLQALFVNEDDAIRTLRWTSLHCWPSRVWNLPGRASLTVTEVRSRKGVWERSKFTPISKVSAVMAERRHIKEWTLSSYVFVVFLTSKRVDFLSRSWLKSILGVPSTVKNGWLLKILRINAFIHIVLRNTGNSPGLNACLVFIHSCFDFDRA